MQDEVNEKTIALYIKTATGQAELKAAYEAERGRFQH